MTIGFVRNPLRSGINIGRIAQLAIGFVRRRRLRRSSWRGARPACHWVRSAPSDRAGPAPKICPICHWVRLAPATASKALAARPYRLPLGSFRTARGQRREPGEVYPACRWVRSAPGDGSRRSLAELPMGSTRAAGGSRRGRRPRPREPGYRSVRSAHRVSSWTAGKRRCFSRDRIDDFARPRGQPAPASGASPGSARRPGARPVIRVHSPEGVGRNRPEVRAASASSGRGGAGPSRRPRRPRRIRR